MKILILFATFCVALLLTACGGDSDSSSSSDPINNEPTGKTYSAQLELPSQASEETYNLGLTGAISNIQCRDSWVAGESVANSSNLTLLKIRWAENTTGSERKTIIKVTTTTNDQLFIDITQLPKEMDSEDAHNEKTDQPAC